MNGTVSLALPGLSLKNKQTNKAWLSAKLAIDMKMSCFSHANKTNFQEKGFALSLVLKVRVFGTRKWPIEPGSKGQIKLCERAEEAWSRVPTSLRAGTGNDAGCN